MSSVNKSFPDPNHFVINDIVSDNIKNLDSTAREGKPPLDLLSSPVKASIHKPINIIWRTYLRDNYGEN